MKMALNWKRGLFRAWIVFAVMWAGVTGWIGYPEIQEYRDYAYAHERAGELLAKGTDPVLLKTGELRPRSEVMEDVANLEKARDANWLHARRAFFVTLVPPLASLLLGGALYWIGRGFSSPRNRGDMRN